MWFKKRKEERMKAEAYDKLLFIFHIAGANLDSDSSAVFTQMCSQILNTHSALKQWTGCDYRVDDTELYEKFQNAQAEMIKYVKNIKIEKNSK